MKTFYNLRDSNAALDWLHDRMPAILPDLESVQEWLDPELKGVDSIDILKPISKDEVQFLSGIK